MEDKEWLCYVCDKDYDTEYEAYGCCLSNPHKKSHKKAVE